MRKEELEFEPFDDVRHAKAMDELVEYVQGGRSEAEAKADLFDEIVNTGTKQPQRNLHLGVGLSPVCPEVSPRLQ